MNFNVKTFVYIFLIQHSEGLYILKVIWTVNRILKNGMEWLDILPIYIENFKNMPNNLKKANKKIISSKTL